MNRKIVANNQDFNKVKENRIVQIVASDAILAQNYGFAYLTLFSVNIELSARKY